MRRAPLIYRLLLRLFPRRFREEFGADVAQLFADRLRSTPGLGRKAALWGWSLADLGVQAVLEWGRAIRMGTWDFVGEGMGMNVWLGDLKYAMRSLARQPAFTLAAILTLSLGIGATVSIFSVVDGVLLSPLPYPDSGDLVVVFTEDRVRGARMRGMDHPDVRAIQVSVPGLSVAGYAGTRPTLTGLGDPEVLYGSRVTDGLVTLMGLSPHLGRDLTAADDVPDGPRVVVVGHGFWSERLGRDPDVLGRTITLNGEPWEIVGVAPRGFDFPGGAQLWMPRRHVTEDCGHGCRIMSAIGRIEREADPGLVEQRLDAMSVRLSKDFPDAHRDEGFTLQPMLEYEVADVRSALWALLGAVVMVLLIACANVANLMIVRAQGRTGEVALRATLGAGRLRIVRQLLTESGLLALASGILGIGLAHWGTGALISRAPSSLPRLEDVQIDLSVLAFAGVLTVLVTGVFGLMPALQVSRTPLHAVLSGGRRSIGRRGQAASRSGLMVAQVALSLTLLLGAGLLVRTLAAVRAVDLGFETGGIERFRLSLPASRYDSLGVSAFQQEMEDMLSALPGVRAVGWGFGVPMSSGSINTSLSVLGRPELDPADRPSIDVRPVTPGYLEAAGMRLLRGRWFEGGDRYGEPGVVVLNEAAARLHFPDRDPLGERMKVDISWGFADTPPATVVGIVGDVVGSDPMSPPRAGLYLPNAQFAASTGYVFLRLESGVTTVIPEARRTVARLDPGLAIWNVTTLDEVVASAHATTTFYLTLLSAFALLALLLAAVGLYGVVAYTVSRRTREIGIRIALGAASGEVVGMVMRQGVRPAALGVVVGLGTSWVAARALSSMLFGVTPQDPLTLVSVTLVLVVVVGVATVLPARRASRVPPSSALRED